MTPASLYWDPLHPSSFIGAPPPPLPPGYTRSCIMNASRQLSSTRAPPPSTPHLAYNKLNHIVAPADGENGVNIGVLNPFWKFILNFCRLDSEEGYTRSDNYTYNNFALSGQLCVLDFEFYFLNGWRSIICKANDEKNGRWKYKGCLKVRKHLNICNTFDIALSNFLRII